MRNITDKYLVPERNNAHNQFANATGFDGSTSNQFFAADGGYGAVPSLPTSRPYIINVSNASAAMISAFDLFGGFQYLNTGLGSWSNGSLTISGVTISSGLSNVSYQFLLSQSINSPFTIGSTQIVVNSGSSGQANQAIVVNSTDASGMSAQLPLTPLFSPNQQQTNTLILAQQFRIDGGTKLTTTILPSVSYSLYLFPQDNINLARGLAGQDVAQSYSNPQLGTAGTVRVLGQ